MTPLRGEVYWLDFDPSVGAEMRAMHPCVIVSNDIGNRLGSLVIVVAVTSNLRAASLPIGVLLPAGTAGLPRDSVAHCGHVYTVDKARLNSRIGVLPDPFMLLIDRALRVSLTL
jgi:mRNA interferase MazF